MSVGNLLISASILYSGNTFTSISEMMQICKVAFLGHTCYRKIQRNILFPVVHYIYDLHRNAILSSTIDLVGDGRCDSPGYSAKYGTYTLMDSSNNNILYFSVVHVGTVANSSRMELKGLVDCLDSLQEEGVKIRSLTTDRHIQIHPYMKNNRNDIKHQFDIWHVGKNIKKKLAKKAKNDLNKWIKSVINHFWWCCVVLCCVVLCQFCLVLFAFSQLHKSLRSIFVCFFIDFKDLPVINKLVSSAKW